MAAVFLAVSAVYKGMPAIIAVIFSIVVELSKAFEPIKHPC